MAGEMQKPGEIRDTSAVLIHEIDVPAEAMGIRFEADIVQTNLDVLDSLTPEASTSMRRDGKKGKDSGTDGIRSCLVPSGY